MLHAGPSATALNNGIWPERSPLPAREALGIFLAVLLATL